MSDEFHIIRNEGMMAQSTYFSGVWLKALRKITGKLSLDSQCLGKDSNRTPSESKSRALLLIELFSR
jgi:hypothetical protein